MASADFQLLVQGRSRGNGSGTQRDDLLIGSAQGDNIVGLGGNDQIYGGWGNDQLHGTSGHNALHGGRGNDTLRGGRNDDLLVGGPGDDKLIDNAGDDTYHFAPGDGSDLIDDQGGNDLLAFGDGIGPGDLWFNRVGGDLRVSVLGSSDSLLIDNWYKGDGKHQLESFSSSNGLALTNAGVDQLVSAMAGFSPSPTSGFTPGDALNDEVAPVIAANWSAVG